MVEASDLGHPQPLEELIGFVERLGSDELRLVSVRELLRSLLAYEDRMRESIGWANFARFGTLRLALTYTVWVYLRDQRIFEHAGEAFDYLGRNRIASKPEVLPNLVRELTSIGSKENPEPAAKERDFARVVFEIRDQLRRFPEADFAVDRQAYAAGSVTDMRHFMSTPLFQKDGSDDLKRAKERMLIGLVENPDFGRFWSRWYEGFLDGHPIDWDLQREVALIPDEDWEKGPKHIARMIAEINAHFALKARIRELEEELARASRDRFGIGGNNPPEAIENAPLIAREFTIIWEPLQDLKSEAESAVPNRALLRRCIERLFAVLADCGIWTARKVDAAVNAAFVAGGTTGGTALVAWVTGHGEKIQHVIKAAEAWLRTLP